MQNLKLIPLNRADCIERYFSKHYCCKEAILSFTVMQFAGRGGTKQARNIYISPESGYAFRACGVREKCDGVAVRQFVVKIQLRDLV